MFLTEWMHWTAAASGSKSERDNTAFKQRSLKGKGARDKNVQAALNKCCPPLCSLVVRFGYQFWMVADYWQHAAGKAAKAAWLTSLNLSPFGGS